MGQEGQEQRKVGSVTYQEVGEEYFEKRGLRRHAGVWSLWALGVGAVISGEFYGWNFGLGTGGFGGLAIAGVLMAIMYYGLVYSIAEMSPALPHTGGAYSFARSAMGPWGGFLTGLAENAEYVITPAVVVGAMALLMQEIVGGLFDVTGDPFWNSLPFWALIFYVIFVGINIVGIEATMRFTVTITLLSLAVLAFFILAAIFSGKLDFNLWTNIAKDGSRDPGWRGARAPVRDQRDLQVVAVRDLVLPGDRGGAARGRGVHGPASRRPQGIRVGHAHAADRRDPHPGLQLGAAGRGLPVRGVRVPAARRPVRDLRTEQRHRAPRVAVHDRPGGQLLHDHLRVRPEHVLALAGGVLPEVPVADPRRAEDPARRADRGSGRRVRRVLPRLGPAAAGTGRADRGGAAQHGGVRRGDLVHHADGVVRPAPREAAEHRAAVPEQGGASRAR